MRESLYKIGLRICTVSPLNLACFYKINEANLAISLIVCSDS